MIMNQCPDHTDTCERVATLENQYSTIKSDLKEIKETLETIKALINKLKGAWWILLIVLPMISSILATKGVEFLKLLHP
jgi:hypothetical protein